MRAISVSDRSPSLSVAGSAAAHGSAPRGRARSRPSRGGAQAEEVPAATEVLLCTEEPGKEGACRWPLDSKGGQATAPDQGPGPLSPRFSLSIC